MNKKSLIQLVRFCIVGGINTLIDLAILNALLFVIGSQSMAVYIVCKTIAFLCALVNSFFMNKYFTFKDTRAVAKSQVMQFGIVTIFGFAANVGVPALVFFLGTRYTSYSTLLIANVGAIIGVGTSLVVNFIGYKYKVFKAPETI